MTRPKWSTRKSLSHAPRLKEGNFEQIETNVSQERGVYIEVHDPTEVEHHPRLDAKIYPFNLKEGNLKII